MKAWCQGEELAILQVPGTMVNTVGKTLSEVNQAYIAGLIDADGAIMASIEHHPEKKYKFRVRVIIKVTQKNREVLDWLLHQTKVGIVCKNREIYDWIIRSQEDVFNLLNKIKPFVRVKKKQLDLALEILKFPALSFQDLLNKARLADTLASFNVRSKNRRKNYVSKIQEFVSRND
ncbi:hypothetical protein KKF92_03660 [Patescibacteria group bacterium]|nr:hypothetical protein [Patescibacteria group bacterium]